jgi:hypothetical protein
VNGMCERHGSSNRAWCQPWHQPYGMAPLQLPRLGLPSRARTTSNTLQRCRG